MELIGIGCIVGGLIVELFGLKLRLEPLIGGLIGLPITGGLAAPPIGGLIIGGLVVPPIGLGLFISVKLCIGILVTSPLH